MKLEIDLGSGGSRSPKEWVLILAPLVLVAGALWLWGTEILATLSPFALAFVFAYLINPAVDAISGERRKRFRIHRALSIFILLFVFVGILLGFLGYVIPNAVHEGAIFAAHFRQKIFPVLKEDIQPRLDKWFARRNVVSNERFEEWEAEGAGPVGWEVSPARGHLRRASGEQPGAILSASSEGWILRQEISGLIEEETYTLEVTTGGFENQGAHWSVFLDAETENGATHVLDLDSLSGAEYLIEGLVVPAGAAGGRLGIVARSPGGASTELAIHQVRLTGAPALPVFDLDHWAHWYDEYKDLFTLSSLSRVMTYGVRGAGVVAEGAGGVWTWLSRTLGGVVSFGVYLVLLLVILFYMLLDFAAFKQSCVELLPDPYENRFVEVMREIDKSLGGFIRGQATICLVVGLLVMTFMALLGVPFAILIGLGAGMFNFIPYLGPTMGMAPAITLTLLGFLEPGADPQWVTIKLGMVVGSFMLVQSFDGFFLSPKILSESVDVPPLVVMGALMLGGSIAGVTGMVLAIPAYCILRVLIGEYQKELTRSGSGKP